VAEREKPSSNGRGEGFDHFKQPIHDGVEEAVERYNQPTAERTIQYMQHDMEHEAQRIAREARHVFGILLDPRNARSCVTAMVPGHPADRTSWQSRTSNL